MSDVLKWQNGALSVAWWAVVAFALLEIIAAGATRRARRTLKAYARPLVGHRIAVTRWLTGAGRAQVTTNEVCSDPAAPQVTSIGQRPAWGCAVGEQDDVQASSSSDGGGGEAISERVRARRTRGSGSEIAGTR